MNCMFLFCLYQCSSVSSVVSFRCMPDGTLIYLSLGSNLGDRAANLEHAIAALPAVGVRVLRRSSIYETEPVDFLDQPWFLNCVVEAETCAAAGAIACCAARDRAPAGEQETCRARSSDHRSRYSFLWRSGDPHGGNGNSASAHGGAAVCARAACGACAGAAASCASRHDRGIAGGHARHKRRPRFVAPESRRLFLPNSEN